MFSFGVYAPINFTFLNSDQGIHALMAANFDWSNSTYYWGQNRLGSIVPFLGSLLIKVGIDPLWAVSWIQYLFLSATAFLFTRIVRNWVLRYSFFILLFFPLGSFVQVVNIGQPYAPQLFFFVLMVLMTREINHAFSVKNVFNILCFWISGIISMWISELSIVPIAVLITVMFLRGVESSNLKLEIKRILLSPLIYGCIIGIGILFKIQKVLKAAFKDPGFESFGINSFIEAIRVVGVQLQRFYNSISFSDSAFIINSFATLFLIITAIIIFIGVKRIKTIGLLKKELLSNQLIFLATGLLSAGVIGLSEWAGIEEYPYRYYVFSYFSFFIGLIVYLEKTVKRKEGWLVYPFFVLAVVGGLSYLQLNKDAGRFKRNAEFNTDVKKMNDATLIGDYWYSYIIGAYNAKEIVSITPQGHHLRNPHQLNMAFGKRDIYLIKNNWIEEFPEVIAQYEKVLLKTHDESVVLGNAILQRYELSSSTVREIRIWNLEKTIKLDENWMKKISEKALNLGISEEEMVRADAKFLINERIELEKMVQKIKSDPKWMESIKVKANKNQIPIEEMVKNDARYVLKTQKKK